ncbi:hypothetical protein [Allostreptomyces psammosilenae]|uniref:Uncharacterized protein n=1 Tax=Allostreptomyces psammosilenae TaxID=1892865 RepID=A0A852ZSY9_9ACTN|nr:hypothetical protein [Allostreptomyces psammosilenae]NYI05449.1 hypothetical protein [Allostreptomyces psammosilenae]
MDTVKQQLDKLPTLARYGVIAVGVVLAAWVLFSLIGFLATLVFRVAVWVLVVGAAVLILQRLLGRNRS